MQTIAQLEKKLEELPLLPALIVRLLALSPDDDYYFDKVLELSEEDPTFALRIIKLSNSAISAPITPITTLRDAVVRLGVNSVAGLVTSMSAMRVFIPTTQGEKNLWVHAIQVAVASRIIARLASQMGVNPEQAYICGLMHDIGRFVLFDKAKDDLQLVDESNWDSPEQLVINEKQLYGFNHSELGARVCKKWMLPETIVEVVGSHHIYELPDQISRDHHLARLIRIIQIADFFSVYMMLHPDAISMAHDELEKEIEDKCISPACSSSPITAQQLLSEAQHILEESEKMMSGRGIAA